MSGVADVKVADLEAALRSEVLPLFTHAYTAHGFAEHLADDWSPAHNPPDLVSPRHIVYQSRMAWAAAELAQRRPDLRDTFLQHAVHAATLLRDHFWDRVHGGVWWSINPPDADDHQARPGTPGLKHIYGCAFALYATANVFAATRDEQWRRFAHEQFAWFRADAADCVHGGYHEALDPAGGPLVRSPRHDGTLDIIHTPLGYKSINAHLHVMEAMTQLHTACPTPSTGAAVRELFAIVLDRMVVSPGTMAKVFTPDFRPVPGLCSYGHDVETGFLLVEAAAAALGDRELERRALLAARMIVDQTLRVGFDWERGGVFDEGPAFGHAVGRGKTWWSQAEMLNALSLVHHHFGHESDRYARAMSLTWRFIQQHFLDHTHGGWFWSTDEHGARTGEPGKATPWKAAYHTARALLLTIERLQGDAP